MATPQATLQYEVPDQKAEDLMKGPVVPKREVDHFSVQSSDDLPGDLHCVTSPSPALSFPPYLSGSRTI
ncbi:hypothetical protein PHYPO_G00007310 [Pangasianodon hypophthalmus]|uniref:Uncharacterized protein n=1 Tax=Pangasianodon hypophthalmus TaxID=310915 RepID=A0A5N5Q4H9_PANHP|nr:hypothetical protein PHYPO_G00007310 [Pangasianodon hypophthalmus]